MVEGSTRLKRNFKKVLRAIEAGLNDELDRIAADLLSRSDALAPQLSGELISTGRVFRRRRKNSSIRVVFYDSKYAVKRHEDFYQLGPVSQSKPGTEDGTVGRKFLERPYNRNREGYVDRLAVRLRREIVRAVR